MAKKAKKGIPIVKPDNFKKVYDSAATEGKEQEPTPINTPKVFVMIEKWVPANERDVERYQVERILTGWKPKTKMAKIKVWEEKK